MNKAVEKVGLLRFQELILAGPSWKALFWVVFIPVWIWPDQSAWQEFWLLLAYKEWWPQRGCSSLVSFIRFVRSFIIIRRAKNCSKGSSLLLSDFGQSLVKHRWSDSDPATRLIKWIQVTLIGTRPGSFGKLWLDGGSGYKVGEQQKF